MSDFAADDLSLPFHLHNFRSMSLHHWSELWLVAVEGGRTWQYTFAADGGYNKVQYLVFYLYYTFSPDGGYNKVKTLVGQVGEVWRPCWWFLAETMALLAGAAAPVPA